jgi:hypothetical protein
MKPRLTHVEPKGLAPGYARVQIDPGLIHFASSFELLASLPPNLNCLEGKSNPTAGRPKQGPKALSLGPTATAPPGELQASRTRILSGINSLV